MYRSFVDLVRSLFRTDKPIPLHEPRFIGKEKTYINDVIDSTYVSSVGAYVDKFEKEFAEFVGTRHAISVVNGTAALQVSLELSGVRDGDEVITQPLSFVATCNAIAHCRAHPVFIDVDLDTLGLSPTSLTDWLDENAEVRDGFCTNRKTGRVIRACVPMHTFGHMARVKELQAICHDHNINLVEDAAESLGSECGGKHAGRFGLLGAFSFNGNKIITTGGGGMIITDDPQLASLARHITTTAKVQHPWKYEHDMVAYNYRMPNINAALGCAQLEYIDEFILRKRDLHFQYETGLRDIGFDVLSEREGTKSNYWLNAILLENSEERDRFLEYTNKASVMTRPAWRLLNALPMYVDCDSGRLDNARWLADRLVNIPSSVVL